MFFSLLLAAFTAAPTLAANKPISVVQKLGPGRQIRVDIAKPEAGKPTFLFLPGVNRGLLLEEPAAQELIKKGYGVVGFNFSVQPISIATLPRGEKAGFYREETTLASLAEESHGLARALAAEYGMRELIPVTLSYTGAVSPSLKFKQIIDSVPLSSMAAFSPELEMYRNWLKAGELFNPVFGPGITRASLDTAYRMQWSGQVDGMIKPFSLPRERREEMIDGYIRLSRATEGFEWKNKGDTARRTFILAAKENPMLLRHQMQVVRERLAANSNESVFLVQESGHIVPAEQPKVYAQILEMVSAGKLQPGLTIVTPSKGEWRTFSVNDSLKLLEKSVSDLPKTPTGTRETAPNSDRVPGTL